MAGSTAVVIDVVDRQQRCPLLEPKLELRQTLIQQAFKTTFKSTANLSKLLPTGTVLAFQILSPIFANNATMEWAVVAVCGLSCVLQSFTDSYKDGEGVVQYGVASLNGLWFFHGNVGEVLPAEKAEEYRIKVIDFVHAFMALLVFAAVALFDEDVVDCLFPGKNGKEMEVLVLAPVGIGFVCSVLFVVFPTTRHGVGFPVAPH